MRTNRLNDLTPKEWIKFQKSWFVHNPPPREKGVLVHPAKFPEDLIQQFIEFFTKSGQLVLDPMAGTGSTLIAALQSGRRATGIELSQKYAQIARQRLERLQLPPGSEGEGPQWMLYNADARDIGTLGITEVDYCITSPPYWDMLRRAGFETQKKRQDAENLDMYYSDDERDLGNEEDYERFVSELCDIYRAVAALLREGAYMTVIVKNVKKGGKLYPLAWDLGKRVGEFLALKDERIWCQDNQRLAPYGMFNAWVSNTMHHYCLNFRKT